MTSTPPAPVRRSLPSPPLRVSLLSAPVSTSSPAPPLSVTPATSVVLASTEMASLPAPPLTTTENVPSAGTVWSPGVALSQSAPLLSPPPAWPWTSRPLATETVTLASAPSRLSVAVSAVRVAEVTAAEAAPGVAARPAAAAASAAIVVVRLMSGPLAWGGHPQPGPRAGEVSARGRETRRSSPRGAAHPRPGDARRSPRPALSRGVGALRLARGRRGPRAGDLRAGAAPPAAGPARGRPRLPVPDAAQHVLQR